MSLLIPEKFLRGEAQAILSQHPHTGTQFPEMLLVEIISRVTLDVSLNMEVLIKLLEEQSLVEGPTRGMFRLVDIPTLGNDAVLDDTGVGDERIYTERCHHGSRVAVTDSRCRMLHGLLTRGDERRHKKS